jgi:hypothetical protein
LSDLNRIEELEVASDRANGIGWASVSTGGVILTAALVNQLFFKTTKKKKAALQKSGYGTSGKK